VVVTQDKKTSILGYLQFYLLLREWSSASSIKDFWKIGT
jgi:hypothetical protein